MTIFEKMHSTALYLPNDDSIVPEQTRCLDRLYDYNQTRPSQMEKRAELIKEMFAEAGEGCYIEPPFYANWGGRHVHLGNPCRVLRELNDHDREYYYRDRKIDWDTLK